MRAELVGDVREAAVSGLAGTTYIDKMDGMKRKVAGRATASPSYGGRQREVTR